MIAFFIQFYEELAVFLRRFFRNFDVKDYLNNRPFPRRLS